MRHPGGGVTSFFSCVGIYQKYVLCTKLDVSKKYPGFFRGGKEVAGRLADALVGEGRNETEHDRYIYELLTTHNLRV